MCYHKEVPDREHFDVAMDYAIRTDEWTEYFHVVNGFEHRKSPIATMEEPKTIQGYNWGYIPKWCKTEEEKNKILKPGNLVVRSDRVFDSGMWKFSIYEKRCLIFVKGFYDWMTINNNKYPHYIFLKGNPTFTMGGLYETWVNKETGEIHNTFAIITTDANPLMAKIHNIGKRMPLIIDEQQREEWMNPKLVQTEIEALMQPYDEHKMDAYTISKLITSRKENPNQVKVKEPFEYPELAML